MFAEKEDGWQKAWGGPVGVVRPRSRQGPQLAAAAAQGPSSTGLRALGALALATHAPVGPRASAGGGRCWAQRLSRSGPAAQAKLHPLEGSLAGDLEPTLDRPPPVTDS